jgi:hypothetical protein
MTRLARLEAQLDRNGRALDELARQLADLDAAQQTGHQLGCSCLACDGWRYRALKRTGCA